MNIASWLKAAARVVFGAGPLIISIYLFKRATLPVKDANGMMVENPNLFIEIGGAAILLIIAGIALAPTIAHLVTTPVKNWIDSLYTAGSGGSVTPELQPAWKLAKKYIADERWEDAIETLQRIVTHYPQERDAYFAGINAARELGDPDARDWFAEAARRNLGKDISS